MVKWEVEMRQKQENPLALVDQLAWSAQTARETLVKQGGWTGEMAWQLRALVPAKDRTFGSQHPHGDL